MLFEAMTQEGRPLKVDLSLLDLLPAAVYICEAPSGRIKYFNSRAVELWGRRPNLDETDERYCGSHRLFLTDGTPLAHADTPMTQVLLNGIDVRDQEVVIEQPRGTRVTVLVNIAPIRDSGGTIVGAVNVFLDITDRKRIEEAHRNAEANLERAIEELTASKTQLQERLEELEQFHELAVGRELKMIQMEKQIAELRKVKHEH
jgi:PAS domain S-box-containing protein